VSQNQQLITLTINPRKDINPKVNDQEKILSVLMQAYLPLIILFIAFDDLFE